MSSPIIVALDFEARSEAMAASAGANHVVIGRAIGKAAEPRAAFAEALSQFKAGSGNG